MENFFTKKKIIIIIVGAIVATMVGLIIGNNIVNSMKAKEKAVEKAKIEKTIEERKDVEEKIKKAKNEDNSEESHYTEEYKEYQKLSDEEKAKTDVIPRKEQVDFGEIKKIEKDQKEDLGKEYVLEEDKQKNDENSDIEVLPKTFDLRDKININVGNQGSFGLCWDYATLTSVQTNLSLTKGLDYNFSEGHVDYMTSDLMLIGGREENRGGNFSHVKNYNETFRGFVLEEEVPQAVYEDYEYNTFYSVPKEDIYITKHVDFPRLVENGIMTDEEYESKLKELQTAVKTHVMNYGSVYTVIHSTYGTNQYISANDNLYTDHAVSIIGWDDNYSKDNFISPNGFKPKHDGAYIVLNSWGEDWGNNGYFYISYEDYWVHSQMSGVVSINDKSDLIKINSLGKNVRKYIKDKYQDQIIEYDGEEYLKDNINLAYLDLSGLNIKDIKEFEVLICRAKSINSSNNNLKSVEGLEDCIINEDVYIDLSNNKIKDVSCLNDLKINALILDENEGVQGYEKLNIGFRLSLKNCGITKLNVADNMQIESLSLSGNKIENYSEIALLEDLGFLELDECGLTSLEPLKDVLKNESLYYLSLMHNNLKDISGLEDASIDSIVLSDNPEIEDYEPLRKTKGTYYVEVDGCNITDAKDILLESISAEDVENAEEIFSEYEYEDRIGITYNVSNNKNISNLKALKNASSIIAHDCNLNDISEFKEIKGLMALDLSNNHGINGDLSGMTLYELYVDNCGLDNDFNAFNIDSICELSIQGNDINKIDKFIDKVTYTVYMDSYDGKRTTDNDVFICVDAKIENKKIEKEIEIPSGEDVLLDINRFIKSNEIKTSNIKINGKKCKLNGLIPVDGNTVISYTVYDVEQTEEVTIKFRVNQNMNNIGVDVMYNPYLNRLKDSKEVYADNIRVANTYGNGIIKETSNFVLESDVYAVPSKYVERTSRDDVSIIFVPEKYYALVKQGNYTAKCTISNISGHRIINVNLCEDLIVPDDFEEEFPMLTFSSEELYEIVKLKFKGLFVRVDDELLTIELSKPMNINDFKYPLYIPRKLLYDVEGLKPVINEDIYIYMDNMNGMDRIEMEDLMYLKEFENLKTIHIEVGSEEYNEEDLIVHQDLYDVEIEHSEG